MKKNIPILIITLVLASIAAFFLLTQRKGTVKESLKDFAVSDTAAITKIFIADKKGNQVLLQRQPNGKWKVNNKFYAQQEIVGTLLTTIKDLRVRTRVGSAEYNSIINDMAATAVKCEIYTDNPDKPAKVYYVGHETKDFLGTYMLMEGSSTPFVMEIPGFNGYLNGRYFTEEAEWRERIVFDYKPQDIRSVTFNYALEPAKSFVIEVAGNSFKVSSPVSGQTVVSPDTIAIENYLGFFSFLNYERADVEFSQHQRDSLLAIGPVYTIDVKNVMGVDNSMKIYPKPINSRSLTQSDSAGVPLKYDLDRMYALVNNGQDFVVIQQFVFGKLFRQLSDFDAAAHKKKMTAK